MKQTPELSIITVNYNGRKDTEELIRSLQEFLTFPYELIVVDNGSFEDEAIILQRQFPDIQTIRSDKNRGFAGGNNLGIEQAQGNYLFFLNNDVIVTDESIYLLVEALNNSPELAGVSPKILFADSPDTIQFAGYTELSRITLRNTIIGYQEKDRGQYNSPRKTPYLHGAAMCIRREVINRVGEMPENYFLYYEELDWCTQITTSGYELGYIPQARVYHKESSSTGQDSPLKAYYMTRNRLLFARRNRQGGEYLFSLLYLIIIAYPKHICGFLFHRKSKQAEGVYKGVFDFLRMKKTDYE